MDYSMYSYNYTFQVKLGLCSDSDLELPMPPHGLEFRLCMFRYATLESERPKPAHHLADCIIQKLELSHSSFYPFFKINPVPVHCIEQMRESITAIANYALASSAQNDPGNRIQIGVIFKVKGTKHVDGDGASEEQDGTEELENCACGICWEQEFENYEDDATSLNCWCRQKVYHKTCIWEWLWKRRNFTCPYCCFDFASSYKNFARNPPAIITQEREKNLTSLDTRMTKTPAKRCRKLMLHTNKLEE